MREERYVCFHLYLLAEKFQARSSPCYCLQLPREMLLLKNLDTISLSFNQIEGSIPDELFKIPTLRTVNFSYNKLTEAIPVSLGEASNLEILNLEGNELNGRLSSSIAGATSLFYLNLRSNQVQGELPVELFSLPLQELLIGGNDMTGTLPAEMGLATDLTYLELGPNLFAGTIQRSIGDLTNLRSLSIEGVDMLEGRLLASYGTQLTNLVELLITGTKIRGNVPGFFGGMTNLEKLDLSNNALRNEIPPELGNLSKLSKSVRRFISIWLILWCFGRYTQNLLSIVIASQNRCT
jgi:Leucine-rich repeat (LRR) protein